MTAVVTIYSCASWGEHSRWLAFSGSHLIPGQEHGVDEWEFLRQHGIVKRPRRDWISCQTSLHGVRQLCNFVNPCFTSQFCQVCFLEILFSDVQCFHDLMCYLCNFSYSPSSSCWAPLYCGKWVQKRDSLWNTDLRIRFRLLGLA